MKVWSICMSSIHDPNWGYQKQDDHENAIFNENDLPSCYTHPDSIDAWRHIRMQESIAPLLTYYKNPSCLTLGDGKFGSDAYFLQRYSDNVLASSLNTKNLEVAHNKGYIKQFKAENAETIDQDANSFDIVFCKEAYHHFPRPSIAFYEMLRVASKAAVLIEPQESTPKILDALKQIVKKMIRKDQTHLFEPAGNYIYRVNKREIEKNLIALNFKYLAYKNMNDFFHPKISKNVKGSNRNTLITHLAIKFQDLLSNLKLTNFGLISLIVFKEEEPHPELLQKLKKNGFKIKKLPINPYV